MTLFRRCSIGLVVTLALAGCAEPPPPDTAPQPEPLPEPEPPPPAKCEALSEGCEADAGTEAPIPGTSYVFAPPPGWIYAKTADATVAQKSDDGAVFVITSFESTSAAGSLSKKRDELFASLTDTVSLTASTASLGKENQTSEMAGLLMSLWERPGGKRGDNEGAVLVFSAPVDDDHIFGFGYAPSDDSGGTAAILDALQSVKKSGDESK